MINRRLFSSLLPLLPSLRCAPARPEHSGVTESTGIARGGRWGRVAGSQALGTVLGSQRTFDSRVLPWAGMWPAPGLLLHAGSGMHELAVNLSLFHVSISFPQQGQMLFESRSQPALPCHLALNTHIKDLHLIQEVMEMHTGLPGASYLVSLTVKWGDTIKLLYRCLQHHIPQEGHKALSIVIPGRKCPKVRGLESSGANKVRQISVLQNFSEPLKLPPWAGTVQTDIKYAAFSKTPFLQSIFQTAIPWNIPGPTIVADERHNKDVIRHLRGTGWGGRL